MEAWVFRRALAPDLPAIQTLLCQGYDTRGPLPPLSEIELSHWLDMKHNLAIVVEDQNRPGVVLAHAQLMRRVFARHPGRAELEDLFVHESVRQVGLSYAILGRLIYHAERVWQASVLEWRCPHHKSLQLARELSARIGGRAIYGEDGCFHLSLPYKPVRQMREHFVPF
ncbi:MAG: hypothetical protein QG626_126 [Patescibacteria group bacterium]|jgi:GNAT superfamily N-acetyltransferase|nr:hypothetical protein [Patescibacteria group bacterium]